jgi:hypothetical protein
MAASGMKAKEIANVLGTTPEEVEGWLKEK